MDDEGSTTSRTGARATAAQKTTRVSARGKKIAILVAGMHRSGTSALTRTLSLLGCDLPKTPSSDAEHWESKVIMNLNDEILASAGSAWHDWGAFNPGWYASPVIDDFRERAQAALESEFGASRLFVLKDPRICRLLGFWVEAAEAFGALPLVVSPIRNPLEVAASLEARDGMDPSIAQLLWLRHVLDAEAASRDLKRAYVRYDDLIGEWQAVVDRLGDDLGVSWPRRSTSGDMEIEEYVSPAQRHHMKKDASVLKNPRLSRWIRSSFEILGRWAHGEVRETDAADLDRIKAAFDEAAPAFSRPVAVGQQAARRGRALEAELSAAHERVTQLEGALASRDKELEAGEARIEELEGALASRDKELEAGKARIEEVKAKLSARERDIQKLKTSTSWRLTKPLRAVSRGLRWLLRNTRRALMLVWWLGTGQFSRAAKASLPYYRRFVPISSQRNASSVKVGHRGENEGQLEKRVVTADNKAALAAFLASGARLCLPASEQPEVCIVLVLYNQAHFTLACLRSIAADVGVPMEVVIVDNASSDETPALLKRIEGARVIWNEENLGFLKGANQGAGEANAPYILFLNNDALLLPGTLSAALETLERESNVGAVGAKIILPGGALQEAGSIIWRDGSCVGYGRGGNPVAPEFMFRRNVDYVSGAFLLTPHQIWKELGGFDLAFAPAYYEETDYCMRMRKAGYRIVYEPRAQISHYEFGSSKDPTAAIELQRNNQSLLYERHKDVLTRAHYASYPRCTLFARSRSAKAGRVLFIDDRVPDPRAGGGFPRANAIVLTLQELGYFVTHYPLRVPEEHWETVYKCMPREVEVMLGHGIDGLRPFLEERKGYYDAVIVSRPHNMAQLKRLLNSAPDLLGGAKLIYDAEAVFALRKNLQWEALGKTMSESRKNENVLREVTMAAEADVVLAVSEGEAAHFRQNLIRDVKILGNMIEPDPTPAEFEERDLFLFVGRMNEDNSPNVDSVIWFYEEILPRLRERIGKLPEIALIGLNSAPQLTKIDRKQLNFIGPIDDLEAYYNRARLFFAPTRFSGGLPHKVHEAAARGVPAVVTPILVHQLGWVHEKEVLVGETAEAFADQCVRLATDRTLWTRLRTSALERVTEECSRETFRTTLQDIMPDCPSSNDLRRMAV